VTFKDDFLNGYWTTGIRQLADWTTRGLADAAERTKTKHAKLAYPRVVQLPFEQLCSSWRISTDRASRGPSATADTLVYDEDNI